jgi:hypothetical protein
MSNTTDAILLVSLTGDQNASKLSVSHFRMSGIRLVFIPNKGRSVADGSETDLCLTVAVLLE